MDYCYDNLLTVWGKQKVYSAAITIGVIANVILNFLLIPRYSYNGAVLELIYPWDIYSGKWDAG